MLPLLRRLLAALILVLWTLPARGQADAGPDWIVTSAGDTLFGTITNFVVNPLPDRIQFVPTGSGEAQFHDLLSASAFSASGYHFERFTVALSASGMTYATALTTIPPAETRTLFLRALVTGPLSLYHYYGSRPHFFIRAGDRIVELEHRIMRLPPEQGPDVVTYHTYRNQLAEYTVECPHVSRRADGVDYMAASLRRLVLAYNECVDPGSSLSMNRTHVAVTPTLWLGASAIRQYFEWDEGLATSTGRGPALAGGATLLIHSKARGWKSALAVDLMLIHTSYDQNETLSGSAERKFLSQSSTGRVVANVLKTSGVLENARLSQTTAGAAIMYHRRFSTGRLRPYAAAGFGMIRTVHAARRGRGEVTTDHFVEGSLYTQTTETVLLNETSESKQGTSLHLKAGAESGRFSAEYRRYIYQFGEVLTSNWFILGYRL